MNFLNNEAHYFSLVACVSHHRVGIFHLTDPPGLQTILKCTESGFHKHREDIEIYCEASHVEVSESYPIKVVDLRR